MLDGKRVNVFVIGAGASVHVDAPLTRNLLGEAVAVYCSSDASSSFRRSLETALEFIDDLLNTSWLRTVQEELERGGMGLISGLDSIDIEEVLTEAEKSNPETELAIHEMIFETIHHASLMGHSDIYRSSVYGLQDHWRNHYDQLVDYIIPAQERNVFISFNYDLFLDHAISINNHGLLGDYSIPFFDPPDYYPGYERILRGIRNENDVDLLKLHGSFNWGWCARCHTYFLRYHSTFADIRNSICRKCESYLTPVLVPPTYNKSRHLEVIRPVWNKASVFLENADSLCVIGYSFPKADQDALRLFDEALRANRSLQVIVIADPEWERVRESVQGLVGERVPVVHEFASFEDMCYRLVGPRANN